ncbi:hypothetical protein DFR74_10115 [Nocardia puris]|uniref:Uncharacterized protein n=1 Tax=Nocardia puris TaxID=208602 RepID=A0A366E3A6_9NOCA|nr:hypothetical protein DFR74_10115 [Nocardia puris]
MAVRFKLGWYPPVVDGPLGREYVGYIPRMTEAADSNRNHWSARR